MQNNQTISSIPFLIVGFVAGTLLALLHYFHFSYNLIYLWIGIYGLLFLLSFPTASSLKWLFIITLIPSYLASIPFVWQINQTYIPFSALLLMIVNAYALNTFNIAYQASGFQFSYSSLFFAVWDTFIKLLTSCFFTAICWIILMLCGNLFDLLGIHLFSLLFGKIWFDIWINTFIFSIGLFIATKTEAIIIHTKTAFLIMMKYLFPVLAFIGVIFLGSWLFLLITQHHITSIKSEPALLFSFFSVIFINAIYQDGKIEKIYPRMLQWLCTLFIIITPIFSALSLQYTIRTIQAKGLHFAIFSLLVTSILLFLYNASYAIIALFFQKPWLKSLGKANIVLAIVLIITTYCAYNPWLFHIQ